MSPIFLKCLSNFILVKIEKVKEKIQKMRIYLSSSTRKPVYPSLEYSNQSISWKSHEVWFNKLNEKCFTKYLNFFLMILGKTFFLIFAELNHMTFSGNALI
jgi:hypothetical protein